MSFKTKDAGRIGEIIGVSRQVMEHRIKSGWRFAVVQGKNVMYNPKAIKEVNCSDTSFELLMKEQAECDKID